MVRKTTLIYILFIILFLIGFFLPWIRKEPGIQLGEYFIPCNPRAGILQNKIYHLQIWDYNWPIPGGRISYRNYLNQAIQDFQKIYPNIKITIKLLDFLDGDIQLSEALKKNEAPDIYCSAYTIPKLNSKRQIPVSPYFKKTEQETYLPNSTKALTYHGILCYFPRWIAPQFWIGNPLIMAASDLSPSMIQNKGWIWNDLIVAGEKHPSSKYLLVGNLGNNGFMPGLIANAGQDSTAANLNTTLDFIEVLRKQKNLPSYCGYNMITRFLNKEAMILVGLQPPAYQILLKKTQYRKLDWQPVLLPIPSKVQEKNTLILETGAIAIYRNHRTKGDDHITAAIRFGQYLSCYPNISPWEHLGFCPAAKEVYQLWIKQTGPNQDLYNRIGDQSMFYRSAELSLYPEKMVSAWNDYVTGKITKQEVHLRLSR